MKLVVDTENTGAQRDKAHPFNFENKMCCAGVKELGQPSVIYKIEYDEEPYGQALQDLKAVVEKASLLILFNGKYDLHWLRRYGIVPSASCRIFDCQLAFFILTAQKHRYPSLDQVAEWCGVEKKLDIVKTEYWDKKLDTDDVPWPILSEYLGQDLNVTEQVYYKLQQAMFPHSAKRVFEIANHDEKVLEEMEWNGFKCDVEKSLRKGDELETKLLFLDEELRRIFDCPWFNPDSGDQLSVMLYGGTLYMDGTEEYEFTYKDGRTTTKLRRVKVPYTRKGIFQPLDKSGLAKEGFYSTDKATLVKLNDHARGEAKHVIEILLERSKMEKRRGTYYHGIPKLIAKMNWNDNVIHGNLNQCTVVTGRLSSDKPNLQNVEDEVKEVFVSRYSVRRKK